MSDRGPPGIRREGTNAEAANVGLRYVVATRGSRLALAQTDQVIFQLMSSSPGVSYEVTVIRTKGDKDPRPFFAMDQKGIFEKEVDRAVADGRADFAVHSLKDVPSELPGGLVLACVPKRECPDDVLVTAEGHTLETLPRGAIIGTGSLRRAVQILRARPDVRVKPIRGNIDTRMSMIGSGTVDGLVLAYAGLARLDVYVRYVVLPAEEFLPSPGQGALAVICRAGDAGTLGMLRSIEDPDSRAEADAERALSAAVGSGCRFPIGARARCAGGRTSIRADAFSIDGRAVVTAEAEGGTEGPEAVGRRAGRMLLHRGAGRLAINWRKGLAEWNDR